MTITSRASCTSKMELEECACAFLMSTFSSVALQYFVKVSMFVTLCMHTLGSRAEISTTLK